MKFDLRTTVNRHVDAGSPLHERVPTVDIDGRPLGDFMMLVPGLRDVSPTCLRAKAAAIEAVLVGFPGVVFAELNVPLNLLWISLAPEFGLSGRVAAGIRHSLPEALLVAPDRG